MNENGNPFPPLEEKKSWFKQPKFWAILLTIILGIVLLLFFYKTVVKESMSTEEVAKSIQISWHDSKWVDKKSLPSEVIIVPSIAFKVKNVGTKPLQYVNFEAVFLFEESGENLSDGFTPALKEPLYPGQESQEIFIKSFYGSKASSKEAFIRNITEWKKIKAKIFARTKNSGYALLGIFPISQRIEGIQVIYQPEESPVPETPQPQP